MIKLVNDSGYNESQIRDNFNGTNGRTGAHIDAEGVVRWNSNVEAGSRSPHLRGKEIELKWNQIYKEKK